MATLFHYGSSVLGAILFQAFIFYFQYDWLWFGSSTICSSKHFKKIINYRQILREDVSVSISVSRVLD